MTYRMLAASLMVLGIGSMFATAAAGAAATVATPSFQGAPRPSAPVSAHGTAPMAAHRFVGQTRGPRVSGRDWIRNGSWISKDSWISHRPEHREVAFPVRTGFPGYGPYYYLPGNPAPIAEPAYPYANPDDPTSERVDPAVAHVPGCSTVSQKVPADKGGDVTINVTRCY
jgi:hypothetical protein